MAESFNIGFPVDGPSIAEVDSLPSRVATLQGMRKGQEAAAIGVIRTYLNTVAAAAQQAGDQLQEPIEDGLTGASRASINAVTQAQAFINDQLAPVRLIAQKYAPPPPKKRKPRTSNGTVSPDVAQKIPPTLPPGCHWYVYPPGRTGPPKIVCPLPSPLPPTSPPTPAPGGSPPTQPPSPAPKPPPTGVGVPYWLILDCEHQEAAGIPNATPEQQAELYGEGWIPWGNTAHTQWACFDSPQACSAYLQSQLSAALNCCSIESGCREQRPPLPKPDMSPYGC